MRTIANTTIWFKEKLLREQILSSHQKEKNIFFFLLYLYEKMDVSWTYCGNYLTIYINIMLYAVYSDVCLLFLKKTWNKLWNIPGM